MCRRHSKNQEEKSIIDCTTNIIISQHILYGLSARVYQVNITAENTSNSYRQRRNSRRYYRHRLRRNNSSRSSSSFLPLFTLIRCFSTLRLAKLSAVIITVILVNVNKSSASSAKRHISYQYLTTIRHHNPFGAQVLIQVFRSSRIHSSRIIYQGLARLSLHIQAVQVSSLFLSKHTLRRHSHFQYHVSQVSSNPSSLRDILDAHVYSVISILCTRYDLKPTFSLGFRSTLPIISRRTKFLFALSSIFFKSPSQDARGRPNRRFDRSIW